MSYIKFASKFDQVLNTDVNKTVYRVFNGEEIVNYTYKDLKVKLAHFKQIIDKYDLKQGDRVCLIFDNIFYAHLTVLCLSYYHITVVLIDSHIPSDTISKLLKTSDCRLLLTEKEILNRFKKPLRIKALDICDNYSEINNYRIRKMIEKADKDAMAIIFSSGTTDSFKPVIITYDSMLTTAEIGTWGTEIDNKSSCLCLFPLFHISGIATLFLFFFDNATICIPTHFNVSDINKLMLLFNPEFFGMIPKVFEVMLDTLESKIKEKGKLVYQTYTTLKDISAYFQKKYNNRKIGRTLLRPFSKKLFGKNLRAIFVGSSKCKAETGKRICDLGFIFHNIYASSECGCFITVTTIKDKYIYDSEGNINSLKDVQIKINEPDQEGIGEILVKSKLMMKGYFRNRVLTAKSFDSNGYFKTGDIGKVDDNGYLHVLGRNKETIVIATGKKVSPSELELMLEKGCPKDNPAVVCGYNINGYDQIHVFLLDKNYTVSQKQDIENKLLTYARDYAPLYPINEIHFVNNFPMNNIMKVKRNELVKLIQNKTSHKYKYRNENMQTIADILDKYISNLKKISLSSKLSSLQLDSLSTYSFISDLENKYKINIISKLNRDTTIKDVLKLIGNKDTLASKNDVELIKLEEKDIDIAIKLYGDAFYNYPTTIYLCPDSEKRKKMVKFLAWNNVNKRLNYSYLNKEKTVYIAYRKPGDKDANITLKILKNPKLLLEFLSTLPFDVLRKSNAYTKLAEEMYAKYYDPENDDYCVAAAVDEKARSSGVFFRAIAKLMSDRPVYAETQSDADLALYEKLGMKVCEKTYLNGYPYYAIKSKLK